MSPSNANETRFLGHNKEWKSTALSMPLPPAPPLCDSNTTSHHVSVDSDDFNWNIPSDSSLVPSSDSSIQSELSLAFDTLENNEGLDETVSNNNNNNNNNNNVTLIRHVNVALKHDDVQEVLRANSLVHRTRTRMNLSSPQHIDLIQSFDVYDTNGMLCRSTTTVCLAKAGTEHVYVMGGSGGSNILKVDLTSRCGDKKVIWLGRGRGRGGGGGGGGKDDDDGNNKRMVRAMAVLDGNTVVTSEQCARGDRHEIRVWTCRPDGEKRESVSKKTCNHYYDYYYYTCVGTLPDRYSWARIRQSLVASNYVRIRRHHTRLWTDHVDVITCLAFCQSNHVLYSVSWDRTLKVWRLSDLRCLQSVARAHDDAINACIVCQRSAALFTAGADATVKLWLPASASSCDNNNKKTLNLNFRVELVATLAGGHKSAVNALALSADGRLLYSGSADRTVQVWAIKKKNGDGRPVATLVGHRGAVLCLSATATATDVLCSGSADKTVRVWRRWQDGTWACVAVLRGHAAPVKSIIIMNMSMGMNMATAGCHLPPSLSVVSASSDGHVRLWSIK